jgi:hypothetical protein
MLLSLLGATIGDPRGSRKSPGSRGADTTLGANGRAA